MLPSSPPPTPPPRTHASSNAPSPPGLPIPHAPPHHPHPLHSSSVSSKPPPSPDPLIPPPLSSPPRPGSKSLPASFSLAQYLETWANPSLSFEDFCSAKEVYWVFWRYENWVLIFFGVFTGRPIKSRENPNQKNNYLQGVRDFQVHKTRIRPTAIPRRNRKLHMFH